MLHDLNLSTYEVAGLLVFIFSIFGSIISVWITMKVKIAQIETTMNLKIAEIETKMADYFSQNSKSIDKFIVGNKEEHREIMNDVKDIQRNIQTLCINLTNQT